MNININILASAKERSGELAKIGNSRFMEGPGSFPRP